MPYASADGVNLYYEVTGEGYPLVWAHEFAGDYRSWEAQVRFFSRRYQVITYNARGYPPSDVPADVDAYSQQQAVEDLRAVLVHLGIQQAHIGGLSMGGSLALHFGLNYPEMCRSLIVAAAGSGSVDAERWKAEAEENAKRFETEGMSVVADDYATGPARVQLQRKDTRGWQEFRDALAEHSSIGGAHTFRGVQIKRPSIFDLKERMNKLTVPTLIFIGDEDEPCVDAAVFMKRNIPTAGLAVLPQSGHTINLEEPDLYNRIVLDFLVAAEAGLWASRELPVEGTPQLTGR
jgi:pimeloyl-ACP methyl ester carboxylesterase